MITPANQAAASTAIANKRKLAKAITGSTPGTPVKQNAGMRLTRGTVVSVPGDGTVIIAIDGTNPTDPDNFIAADALGSDQYLPHLVVEVLIAGGRTVVLGLLASSVGADWIGYVCDWSASIAPPNMGNATMTSRYKRVGKQVFVHISLVIPTGFTGGGGSGYYGFSLPFACASGYEQELMCKFYNSTMGFQMLGFAYTNPGTTECLPVLPINATSGNMSNACNEQTVGSGVTTAVPRDNVHFPFNGPGNFEITGEYETT